MGREGRYVVISWDRNLMKEIYLRGLKITLKEFNIKYNILPDRVIKLHYSN